MSSVSSNLNLNYLVEQIKGIKAARQLIQGFQANPQLMFEVFKALSENSDALSTIEAELQSIHEKKVQGRKHISEACSLVFSESN